MKNEEEIVDELSQDERSLLVYLETRAVDHGGIVAGHHMNEMELKVAEEWNRENFIRFTRLRPDFLDDVKKNGGSHAVELSDIAYNCVTLIRKRRAKRSQNFGIVQSSFEYFQKRFA